MNLYFLFCVFINNVWTVKENTLDCRRKSLSNVAVCFVITVKKIECTVSILWLLVLGFCYLQTPLSTVILISFQYIYIAHLESDFCRFSNVTLQFSCLGHFAYCVIPLLLRRGHPLPDQLPGEHTGLPSHMRQYLFTVQPFNAALNHGR